MDFSFNINFLTRCASLEKAAQAMAKAGFKYLDYTPRVSDENWKEDFEKALEILANMVLRSINLILPCIATQTSLLLQSR